MITRKVIWRCASSLFWTRKIAKRIPGHNTEKGIESFGDALVVPIIIPANAVQKRVPRKLKMIVNRATKAATMLQALAYLKAVLIGWKLITGLDSGLS